MRRFLCYSVILLCWAASILAQDRRPLETDDLFRFGRVADPQVSPDGERIAYTVSFDNKETNKTNSDIWLIPVEGGEPLQLTNSPEKDYSPRWAPDGERIAFVSDRDGNSQIWVISVEGGEAKKVTSLSTGLSHPVWSPDGRYLLARSRVYPDCASDEENRERDEAKENDPCKARIIDELLYRHWNTWRDRKRNHLFLVNARDGTCRDVTPGDYDCPPISLGSSHDYTFSPEIEEICFVRNIDPMVAISTNNDLFTIPIDGGTPQSVTTSEACDNGPRYSPDGRYIAYRGMKRPGFESDRYRLMLYERTTGEQINLTEDFDRSVREFVWSPDSRRIYFTCRDRGRCSIHSVDIQTKRLRQLSAEGYSHSLAITPGGRDLVFVRSYCHYPDEIYRLSVKGGEAVQITFTNERVLAQIEMNPLEELWFEGAEGTRVHGYLLKPPFFEGGVKYPAVLVIHGGPQSMWGDRFMYRWFNFQLLSAPGYVSIFINPRGSAGYGQKFVDEVSTDYGNRCYVDLMKGLNFVCQRYAFIDTTKIAAVGGSFGGYMVNWIVGHTDRFDCAVSHAGLYNLISFYGATEELWFPEWDLGQTPWENPEGYSRWSPHRFAQNFKTPVLITHGQQDFRVPVEESMQLFTACQRQGVPTRFVYFPDEGHVIEKPRNVTLWWRQMYDWFEKYLK
ncbi:MAG: prolyl oligopeptidase family serine peptidase [bacterium]